MLVTKFAGMALPSFLTEWIRSLLKVSNESSANCRMAISLVVVLIELSQAPDTSVFDPSTSWPELAEEATANEYNLTFSPSSKSFGFGLLAKYMLPLQVSGFLLLAAMVGVIILSKKFSNTDPEEG